LADLRPAEDRDRDFLLALYAGTRASELALVDWDEESKRAFVEHQFNAQDEHYRSNYPGASFDVIEVDGQRAGRLYVHRADGDIRIMDIVLAPAFRGRGIGTELLRSLMAESDETDRKLSIHVELNNPARSLYDRLGFKTVGEHGIYVLMERPPNGVS
jgi:ribosomal protein S18 acetylase RimI-like enzyme